MRELTTRERVKGGVLIGAAVLAGGVSAVLGWGLMVVIALVLFCWGFHTLTDQRPPELRR